MKGRRGEMWERNKAKQNKLPKIMSLQLIFNQIKVELNIWFQLK